MCELDYKESWVRKNWSFQTVVLEKTLEDPLDCKEIQPLHPKGDQSWMFIGRTDVEAETPILWPPDIKNWLIWKDAVAGKDWRREKKERTEDVMVGWHHRLNGHEFEQTLGDNEGQGSLACCTFSSVQFSRSVMSDSLQPHELQHARPPCPSPSPGVHSNSHPSSQWCHPAISSSVAPFSSCPQSLPAWESFPVSQLFTWGGQSTGVSALASFLPKKSQGWSP